jgi:hypothetical protein
MDLDDDRRARLLAELQRLADEGCPFAVGPHEKVISVAVRRWTSFEARRRRPSDRAARVADLTDGLYAAFQPPRLQFAGDPLVRDVECVAEAIAAVLDPVDGT